MSPNRSGRRSRLRKPLSVNSPRLTAVSKAASLSARGFRAGALPLPMDWLAHSRCQFGQWGGVLGRRQGVEIATVAGLRHLGAACEIGHAFTHRHPLLSSAVIAFLGAISAVITHVVERGFDTQDLALFVVHFDAVAIDPVLDPDSFATGLLAGMDFRSARLLATEKAQDIGAGEVLDAVMHQLRIEAGQIGWVPKKYVGSPLTLLNRPVIVHGMAGEEGVVSQVGMPCQLA